MSELTGRDLDAAVAAVLGWRNVTVRPLAFNRYMVTGIDPADGVDRMCPKYSDPWCSGLAPVLAWLTEQPDVSVTFESERDGWRGLLVPRGGRAESLTAPTLPEVAARLLVAWAKRRGT
jgi:hypothetical protein